jgi:maleylacetate reductase
MKSTDGPAAIRQLTKTCGAPVSLMAIGIKAQDLDKAADMAMQNAYWNPRVRRFIGWDRRLHLQ